MAIEDLFSLIFSRYPIGPWKVMLLHPRQHVATMVRRISEKSQMLQIQALDLWNNVRAKRYLRTDYCTSGRKTELNGGWYLLMDDDDDNKAKVLYPIKLTQ